ncbi:hypothetical protein GCM10011360_11190 [Primorskyibacter flagellatus]|uniref:Lipoprotein n=1 Tax=Primorskyibacter flagellatus TaxID=1387277 RepID=A0A917A3G5_9RHOB|nr:hypothetical protein [Primorskyibacter flagellatus]GGE24525.1 hypothetical protein GCM10011360_11190 [Primorskyibacter flagellatus]
MRKSIPLLLIAALVLSSCGNSRLNPFNWFGKARSRAVAEDGVNPLIPERTSTPMFGRPEEPDNRTPVSQVTELVVERVPGGAIVRATGVPLRQGAYQVLLRPVEDGSVPEGVLRYTMLATQPLLPQGTVPSRQVTVGAYVSEQDLAGIRQIEVQGGTNVMSVRR